MEIRINMDGKVALVTGAASGLGRATAIKLASAGAKLCLVDVDETGLAETSAIIGDSGGVAIVQVADLTDPVACSAPVDHAADTFGRFDALCNVAGLIYMAKTPDMPVEQLQRTIAVNLTAPFLLSQSAIPHLLKTEGAIVNVASSAAFLGEAYAAAYCASKSGLVGMTKAMAMEYAKQPIRINAVAPGGMMTNIATNMKFPDDADVELIRRYTGLRGLVEVDDVADMVCLLASDAGRGYHGACINIDAGITAG
ncbi:SDR family NAD(P)-dependent oxidoreductase [Sphingorhabdus sp. M41]|uniref:SDR family NAD(P)-dependent oxidoreductase n=1 Tax=Sphingorhabdus sp. M41 TaxID=1806885 RepID=UPI00078B6E76|nr:SDR family NAD(P)-dependent oxidoreductase [Sphingorhabdus sp. M41]AMO71308.1 short-chain dehydrogenase [Sphingorhabdus sp. M41]